MDLREVNVALGTIQGTPLTHSTLQGTQHARVVLARMAALQLLQQRDRVKQDVGLQQRHDLSIPNL
jgi:hypothetical protein